MVKVKDQQQSIFPVYNPYYSLIPVLHQDQTNCNYSVISCVMYSMVPWLDLYIKYCCTHDCSVLYTCIGHQQLSWMTALHQDTCVPSDNILKHGREGVFNNDIMWLILYLIKVLRLFMINKPILILGYCCSIVNIGQCDTQTRKPPAQPQPQQTIRWIQQPSDSEHGGWGTW